MVIAIIAILAAILFPVFAQAKEAAKKTQSLSNAKQMGTSFSIYTSDYDDVYPLGAVYFGTTYYAQFLYPYPEGWIPGWDGGSAAVKNWNAAHWSTAVIPYTKNTEITSTGGGRETRIASDNITNPLKSPGLWNLGFNGLLSSYSATGVDNPSLVTLAWSANGNVNVRGRALTSPYLGCANGDVNCRFNPAGAPNTGGSYSRMGGGWGANDTIAAHNGNQGIFVYSDTHAKSVRYSMNVGSVNTNVYEPCSEFTQSGFCSYSRYCTLGDPNDLSAYNLCYFRPDFDGTRTKWTAIVD